MNPGSDNRSNWTCLVILTLLLQALLPAVMHAGVGQRGVFAEICTAMGVQTVRIASDSSEEVGGSQQSQCLLCMIADTLALPHNPPLALVPLSQVESPTAPVVQNARAIA